MMVERWSCNYFYSSM